MSKKFAYLSAAAIGAAALLATAALPASAAQSGDTVTTFALQGGTIDIVVQATAAITGGNSGATSASGQLGAVTVTDGRGVVGGWTASGASTTFSNASTTSTAVAYNSGTVSTTGTVTATGSGTVALTGTAAPVVVGTLVTGNNTATWNPTLTVTLPATSTAGSYTGTVTTSVV